MSFAKHGLWFAAAGVALMAACASDPGNSGGPDLGQTSSSNGGGLGSSGTPGASSGGGTSGGSSGSSNGGSGSSNGGSGSSNGGSGSSGGSSSGVPGSGSGAATMAGSMAGPPDGGGAPCGATVASNAVALSSNYLAAGTVGKGGYAYSYQDGMGSTACMTSNALCGKGMTAVADTAGMIWGAGIGVNLNQAVATGSTSPAVNSTAVTGTGVQYALTNLPPQGMRIVIDNGGTDYCAPIDTASGTVYWASFNTKCWDYSGTSLSGPPTSATHLLFQITSDAAAGPFDLCVTSASFSTSAAPPPDAGGSSGGSGSSSGGNGTGGCAWSGGPASGNGGGELTCYWFGQGTARGSGCPSFKTFCGYCGTESGGGGGTCPSGITDSVSNIATPYFAAFPSGSFGQGKYCGMCVDVSYGGKTITATIVDECGTCGDSGGHIDLSLSAAVALGIGQGSSSGNPRNGVTWTSVACPVTGDIVAVFNNGSSSQIYFENVAFPVASATAGGSAGNQSTGFWSFSSVVAGKAVTLTDTLGHTIHGTIPTGSGGSIGAQFPATCP